MRENSQAVRKVTVAGLTDPCVQSKTHWDLSFTGERERATVRSKVTLLHFRTYVLPLPPYSLHKGTFPLVPTHQEFLRHCWGHHDNWVHNKAFILGILPFTEERGNNSQRRKGEKRKRLEELERTGRGQWRGCGGGENHG